MLNTYTFSSRHVKTLVTAGRTAPTTLVWECQAHSLVSVLEHFSERLYGEVCVEEAGPARSVRPVLAVNSIARSIIITYMHATRRGMLKGIFEYGFWWIQRSSRTQ